MKLDINHDVIRNPAAAGDAAPSASAQAAPRTRVVMIGGLPRSGTTVVTDVLNESAHVAIMAEYEVQALIQDLQPIFGYGAELHHVLANIDTESARQRTSTITLTDAGMQLAKWPLGPTDRNPPPPHDEPAAASHYVPYDNAPMQHTLRYPLRSRTGTIASAVIRASLDKPQAGLVGSKYPLFMLNERHFTLHEHFDDVRYVILLRNPHSQINSSLNRRNRSVTGVDTWHIGTIDEAVTEFRRVVARTISLLDRFPGECLIVKFEDIEERPTTELRRLFDFLEIDDRPCCEIVTAERGVRNILTPSELAHLHAFFGDVIERWPSLKLGGTAPTALDSLACLCEAWPQEQVLTLADLTRALGTGWSEPDTDGVWSDGARADLVFAPVDVATPYYIKLEADWHMPNRPIGMRIELNGDMVCDAVLVHGNLTATMAGRQIMAIPVPHEPTAIWLGPVTPRADGPNLLTFMFDGVQSPAALGLSDDPRQLGMHLRSLTATTL